MRQPARSVTREKQPPPPPPTEDTPLNAALAHFAAAEYSLVESLLHEAPASDVPARLLLRRARLAIKLNSHGENARSAAAADGALHAVTKLLQQLDALPPAKLSKQACGGKLLENWFTSCAGASCPPEGAEAHALLVRLHATLEQGGDSAAALFGTEKARM